MLVIFKRKVIWIIFNGINDNGNWHRRYNFELYILFRDVDILKFIKLNRMRWAGHMRMECDRAALKVFNTVPFGQRPRGRLKTKWLDCLDSDFSIINIKNWRYLAKRRTALLNLLKKARAHNGLSSQLWWWWWWLTEEMLFLHPKDFHGVKCHQDKVWLRKILLHSLKNEDWYKCWIFSTYSPTKRCSG